MDSTGVPVLSRNLPIFSSKFPQVPVTSFTLTEDFTKLAVGLGNGAVMLFEGNILRANPKQDLLQREGACVTGVHFREGGSKLSLFVVTTTQVLSFFPPYFSNQGMRIELDNEGGCELRCSVLSEAENGSGFGQQLVAARKEAVFFYDEDSKGICFGFDGMKKLVGWFSNYLVLVNEIPTEPKKNTLTIYDLKNKFIAYAAKVETVVEVVAEWGALFILTASHKCYQLTEKDLASKLQMLYRKNLFQIAISLASSQDVGRSRIMDIYQKFGDHLYKKQDFDGAITQYLETINYLEPSYVIRKFLDAQRIHNLTRYLEALHSKDQATPDHTTLLLNCYTKLKAVEKLDEFVKSDKGFAFDVGTAIQVCRQAGYFQHAMYLAFKNRQHASFLKIVLEDERKPGEALKYIASLPFEASYGACKEYGQQLVQDRPEQATALFQLLCLGYKPTPYSFEDDSSVKDSTPSVSSVSVVTATAATSSVATTIMPSSAFSSGILSELATLLSGGSANSVVSESSATPQLSETADGDVDRDMDDSMALPRANVEEFLQFYVDRPLYLQQLLDAVLREVGPTPVLVATLLELYLPWEGAKTNSGTTASGISSAKTERKEHPRKHHIMNLLKRPEVEGQPPPYDANHALVLCKMYNFERGILYLYGKLKLYDAVVQHHMERNQYKKIIKACENYGKQDQSLWIRALGYFAAKEESCEIYIQQVLETIEKRSLLPPLQVVQILSRNPKKTLSVVKDYIIQVLQHENEITSADRLDIARYREQTAEMRAEIKQLKTRATTFQGIKCDWCTSGLSLPAVHFLCQHSFHQRCIVDSDRICPKCAPEFRKVKEIQEGMRRESGQHDTFFKKIKESQDSFAIVADYFGRGIFDKTDSKSENAK
eukprot:gb/GEZN01001267.1/.p1 GENE.gb/GEZN01001267.1/~~gb/GEZN01001267.1/.p1  ORF type:complete len:995 (+),score=149.02 gb/GEZN01001267.1/:333-2987(+)